MTCGRLTIDPIWMNGITKIVTQPGAESPTIIIRPSSGWVSLDLREVWRYRELLYFLTWRDIKVRYKQTVLGAAWAVIQPLFTMLVFTLFFGKLARMPSDGIPYPIFSYAALLPWTYFANALSGAGNSLVGSANLITKVYFPRIIVPGSAVLAGLLDYAIALVVLLGLMVWYGVLPGLGCLLFVPLTVLTCVFALGVGMWLAALNVQYRDVRYAIPFLIQLWMFATPIVYPLSVVPPQWRWAMALNPMAGLIEGFRASLLGRPIPWLPLGISGTLAIATLVTGAFYFRRMEKTFADIV